jgi:hypothetical protein
MPIQWIPLLGNFEIRDETIVFTGSSIVGEDGKTTAAVGNLLSNQFFGGGTIEASIEFVEIGMETGCGLILHYQPATYSFVEAQLGSTGFCSVWTFANNRWTPHGQAGDARQIKAGRPYRLRVNAVGSSVNMWADDVHLLTATLPFPLPRGQAGIWCRSLGGIRIRNFTVEAKRPTAFVVMQFTAPYNELYAEVIKPVCEELGLTAVRLDETFGPGVIIRDIERQILEAQVIIADITPANSNVY